MKESKKDWTALPSYPQAIRREIEKSLISYEWELIMLRGYDCRTAEIICYKV